jgi:cytochrome c-type biogenesis protein CcmH
MSWQDHAIFRIISALTGGQRQTRRLPSRTFLLPLALLLAVAIVWIAVAAHTAGPPTLDDRVHAVAAQLQCPVCHNGESAADSSSEEAAQMRGLIRQQLRAGWSAQQSIQYFHERYGDAILESPPKQGFTVLIWIAPVLALLAGLSVVISAARTWRPTPATRAEDDEAVDDLSSDERARLADVLHRELAAEEGFAPDAGMEGA